jgi:glycosyltransferase involved in cell wall biosynthesis
MTTIAIDARKIADFGIGTYVRGLVSGLARIDHERRYLLLSGPEGPDALPHLPGNFRWVGESARGYSVREMVSVSRRLRREAVDLFHAPHYVVPLAPPCPVVVTVHDLIHLRFPEFRSRLELAYARTMIRRAVRISRRVLTVSTSTAEDLTRRFAVPPGKIDVVANGVDDAFRSDPSEAEVRTVLERLGLRPGYLLFVGNPKPHKNVEGLLTAYAELRRRRPDAPLLVLAGERETDRSPVAARLAAHGLADSVRRLGFVAAADLPALYHGAVLLVQPSLWEGFGLPVAEAMAAGTAVIASRRGALPEVAGDAARLVEPEDVGELAAAIDELLREPAVRADLARRGRQRAARYRWEETARATLATYDRALAPDAEEAVR